MFVYILYSPDFDRWYVGMTVDILKWLQEHNSGKTPSTKPFVPWIMKHSEHYPDRLTARKREKYLKSAAGRRWRKKNLKR